MRITYFSITQRLTENLRRSATAPGVGDGSREPALSQGATLDGMGAEPEGTALTTLLPGGGTKSQPGGGDKLCLEKRFPHLC